MVGMSVCLKVLLMWSWAGEKAAPGLLGSEPCGGDLGSTWCWVGQCQLQVEVVLRVWDVPPERLQRDNAMGGLLSETLCLTAAAGQEGCVGVVYGMLGFPQR